MIDRDKQSIKNDASDTFGASRPVKLSTTMVDLSLRHDRRDQIPLTFPIRAERYLAKANLQLASNTVAVIPEEKANKAAQLDPGVVPASRALFRISIFRISVLAFALLGFAVFFALHGYCTHFLKGQSKIPAMVQQGGLPLVPVSTVVSESTHNHDHAAGPKKAKSRRRDGYIAKDTYVYYGKDGKPSH
jgi:hypothetical protein